MDARILVTGGDLAARRQLADTLGARGFLVTERADTHADAAQLPALVVVLGGEPAIVAVKDAPLLRGVPILALVPPDQATAALAAGADDLAWLPLADPVLRWQVDRMLRLAVDRRNQRAAARCEQALLDIERTISGPGDTWSKLREVLAIAAATLDVDHVTLLMAHDPPWIVDPSAENEGGDLSPRAVDLFAFPEAESAIATREAVMIGDATAAGVAEERRPYLAEHAKALAAQGIRGVIAFPVEWRGHGCGALLCQSVHLIRLHERHVAFARILAGTVAQMFGAAPAPGELREQTQRVSLVRVDDERRVRAIERVQAYFEAAADGIVVMNAEGRILYLNHAAETLTGFAREGLVGQPLTALVPEEQRAGIGEMVANVLAGSNLEPFDLEMATTSGDRLCVSVATSTVLAEHGAAILSFRDVTSERLLEAELRKTKDFLEKLIDSTVDAIVAADVSGKIMLFNPGAERIFGWSAEDVIGQVNVERFYPEGVARQIMRMLRAPSYGGVGRLEVTRREIVTKEGELVPVNMTASIIYENGREVATVGIFSDLRERIRIEQRLLQAQEKLLVTEKQAVIAELAGAAAHELNQPLTSVMLYLEMMLKKVSAEDVSYRAINAIQREADRMAEIVKKIGRITRYETKQYVGGASILDLEKASSESVHAIGAEGGGPGGAGAGASAAAGGGEPEPKP
jgi:PAS domain S-box-containing protein